MRKKYTEDLRPEKNPADFPRNLSATSLRCRRTNFRAMQSAFIIKRASRIAPFGAKAKKRRGASSLPPANGFPFGAPAQPGPTRAAPQKRRAANYPAQGAQAAKPTAPFVRGANRPALCRSTSSNEWARRSKRSRGRFCLCRQACLNSRRRRLPSTRRRR